MLPIVLVSRHISKGVRLKTDWIVIQDHDDKDITTLPLSDLLVNIIIAN